ncbi:MAG: ATP-binding protein [bacterium]
MAKKIITSDTFKKITCNNGVCDSDETIIRINKMIEIVMNVAKGIYSEQVQLSDKNDEIDALGIGVNMMIDDIKKNVERIKKEKINIDKQEKRRTIELEEERNKFYATAESIFDGILVIDSKGNILTVNSASEGLLGIKKEQVIGRHILDCLEDVKILDLATRKLEAGNEYYTEELIITDRITNTEKILNGRISSVFTRAGKRLGTVIVLRDITKEKEAERMKNEFVSNVSHEIRTPLSSIKGFVDTLLMVKVSEAERKKFLNIIKQESNRLNQLISDLLDLSRIESRRVELKFEPVDVLKKLEAVKSEIYGKISRKNLFFEIKVPGSLPPVKADKNALFQILVNLISNAIKFTEKGGKIDVKAELCNKKERVKFSVRDTGYGIEEKYWGKIFEKFYRIETSSHKIPGTGLGLSIVKDLVEKHNGKIWVESKPGEGSTFYFTIPVFTKGEK